MAAVFLIVGILCFPAILKGPAAAEARGGAKRGPQDFTLVNRTGVEIYALYVAPHNSDDWEEDILGADTLPAGESLEITFSRSEKAKLWDLRVEDKDENYIEWENLNLLEISTVTIYYKNGKATAVVE
jgi:hypothetical protein